MAVFRTKILFSTEEEYLIEAPTIQDAHDAAGREFWETHEYRLLAEGKPVRRVVSTVAYSDAASIPEARRQTSKQLSLFDENPSS